MMIFTLIKYQIFRNKWRSILWLLISMVLLIGVAVYLLNIQTAQNSLNSLSQSIPVITRVVSTNGENTTGLTITTQRYDAFASMEVKDVLATASAVAFSKQIEDNNFLEAGTQIKAINNINCIEGLSENDFVFAQGQSPSDFSSNINYCTVSKEYAELNSYTVGDDISLWVYAIYRSGMTVSYDEIGMFNLKPIGIHSSDSLVLPQMLIPVQYLREQAELAEVEFYYDSLSAQLKNPLNLNEYKSKLTQAGFMQAFEEAESSTSGDAISVEDEFFIKAASELINNLSIYNNFVVLFFTFVVFLISLTSFMLIKSNQKEMAISISLGVSKKSNIIIGLVVSIILVVLSCFIVFFVLHYLLNIGISLILITFSLFILCSIVGNLLALLLVLRFNTLDILTKID